MAEQEFLASFGVEIDESGVEQLQKALEKNRELAEALASAFDKARASVQAFFHDLSEISYSGIDFNPAARVTEEQQGISLPFSLDFTKANKELSAFFKAAGKSLSLNADASGVVAAGRSALAELQSLYASTVLQLQAEITETVNSAGGESGSEGSGGSSESSGGDASGSSSVSTETVSFQAVAQAATGGRFDEPTTTQIAEDGDPEYVIPVKKESLAVPLLRQLIGELSDSAQQTLRQAVPAPEPVPAAQNLTAQETQAESQPDETPLLRQVIGELSDTAKETLRLGFSAKAEESGGALAGLPDLLASAQGSTTQIVNQSASSNVSAPVSIQVTAAGSDPEAVGRSIYDVTEQYLLRTLQSAMG